MRVDLMISEAKVKTSFFNKLNNLSTMKILAISALLD